MMNKKGQSDMGMGTFFVLAAVTMFIALFLAWGIAIVDYHDYAFEKEFGKLKPELKEQGFRWVGFGSLMRVNNQVRNYEITINAASSDYQDVIMQVNLNTKIKKDKVYNFLTNYQSEEMYQQYLDNKVQEKAKTIILKYSAEEVLNKRLQISKELSEEIKDIPELEYFELNDLAIKDIQFSEKFSEVLEKKAQVLIEREILTRQKENLQILQQNTQIVDIDTYFKYQLIEKWDGHSSLFISDGLLNPK